MCIEVKISSLLSLSLLLHLLILIACIAFAAGLIGLAACAIGLVPDIERFLHLLIPPVLECFDDPESRVCYYAW